MYGALCVCVCAVLTYSLAMLSIVTPICNYCINIPSPWWLVKKMMEAMKHALLS